MPKPTHYNYPSPIKIVAPLEQQSYQNPPAKNPIVSGYTLTILANIVCYLGFVKRILWNNANFGELKKIKILDNYVACFDPCVVPLEGDQDGDPSYETVEAPIDTAYYTSQDFVRLYEAGATTPTAVAEKLLSVIGVSPHKTAIIQVLPHLTKKAAEASTLRYQSKRSLGPLDGVPIVVKDEVDLHGYEKTFGSAKIWDHGEGQTSWCVQKLIDAGAIVIAKTNMHEIGSDTTNCNPVHGTPRNPHNRSYYTGGSSGGSAYCVGTGIVPIAVGADGGGSIRIPSNYCGVYGIKPSHGRLSGRPSPSLSHSNGVLGPICGTIEDLKIAYRIMAEPDSMEQSSSSFPQPRSPTASLTAPKKKILGVYRPWFNDCSEEVRMHTTAAVQQMEKHGYKVVDLAPIPYLSEARSAHGLSIVTDMAEFCKGDTTSLAPSNKVLMSTAYITPAVDIIAANKVRSMLMSHMAAIWKEYPGMVIVTPTVPNPGVQIREGDLVYGASDANQSIESMRYVFLANFTGTPSICAGVGYDTISRLPISLMGTAEWGREEDLLGFAADVVKASGIARHRPENWVDVLNL